jgi:hypothetical protein
MERNRKLNRSVQRPTAKSAALELPPERAFVVHLDARAQPPSQVVGRVEHVTSGRVGHVTSLSELVAFMTKVLRNQVRGRAKKSIYNSGAGAHAEADESTGELDNTRRIEPVAAKRSGRGAPPSRAQA